MRRILQIITKSELGGAQSHVADLLEGLRGADTQLHLATGTEGPLTHRARELGVQVHLLPRLQHSINPLADMAAVREFAALIRRVQPHIVHAHSSKAGVVARLAGRRTGVPVVFTAHGWGFSPGASPVARVLAWGVEAGIASLGARIVCVSEDARQKALRLGIGNRVKLVTIHNGIAPDAEQAQPATEPPRIVMVARFAPPKDYATFLHAIALLDAGSERDFTVELVGSGPLLEPMQVLARELNVQHRVTFLGDRQDIAAILASAQVFVLSSQSEGLPISIMEAMRAGLPVVATDVGGVAEEVEHGQTGFTAAPRDAKALAGSLDELLRSPARRAHIGMAARQKFEREFTRQKMLNSIESLYAQVAPRART